MNARRLGVSFGCLFGHDWEWVPVREGWGCVESLRCLRCGRFAGFPLGAELCRS